MIQLFLIAAHFLADFTLQSSDLAQRKRGSRKFLLLHGGIYGAVLAAAVFLAVGVPRGILPALIIALSHLLIDAGRIRLDRAFPNQSVGFWSFVADQVLHIGTIFGCVLLFTLEDHTNRVWDWLLALPHMELAAVYAAAFIIVWDPACVFVKMLFYYYGDAAETELELPPSNPNAGALIGKLERVLLVILVLAGQMGSIAFVLTAKSLARHKQLEDMNFAEKYLVGTLASAAIAVLTAMLLRGLFL